MLQEKHVHISLAVLPPWRQRSPSAGYNNYPRNQLSWWHCLLIMVDLSDLCAVGDGCRDRCDNEFAVCIDSGEDHAL